MTIDLLTAKEAQSLQEATIKRLSARIPQLAQQEVTDALEWVESRARLGGNISSFPLNISQEFAPVRTLLKDTVIARLELLGYEVEPSLSGNVDDPVCEEGFNYTSAYSQFPYNISLEISWDNEKKEENDV